MNHIQQLREIAPYIRAHQNSTLVVLFSGEVQQLPHYPSIIKDLLLLHSIGVRLVTVFGCRPQINQALQSAGLESNIVNGKRVTNAEHLDTIISVVAKMQMRHTALFTATARATILPSQSTSLAWGNWITAQPIGVLEGVDFAHTGKVRKTDVDNIEHLLDGGHIVAIHPLAASRLGDLYNLSSEDIAGQLARKLNTDKLIIFTDKLQLPESITKPGAFVDCAKLDKLLPSVNNQGHQSLLQLAIDVCRAKPQKVHFIDTEHDGALLKELFTRDGSSLMVTSGNHERLQQAHSKLIPEIHELIKPMEKMGYLRPRDLEMLEKQVHDFYVLLLDETIIGCASLHKKDNGLAELACFVIAPEYQGKRKGFRLLSLVEQQAIKMNISQLVVLTTQTNDWFEEHGFNAANKKDFAGLFDEEQLDACRNARLLIKTIRK